MSELLKTGFVATRTILVFADLENAVNVCCPIFLVMNVIHRGPYEPREK